MKTNQDLSHGYGEFDTILIYAGNKFLNFIFRG